MNKRQGPDLCRIAYFISPHGYGHAARASAVMDAIHDISPSLRFEIFTTVPQWFFEQSLTGPFAYHSFIHRCWVCTKVIIV